jgi:hypothetical protein
MIKKLALPALAVAALALVSQASAKQMSLLQICGADGCKAFKSGALPGHDGSLHATAAPAIQSYYMVRLGIRAEGRVVNRFEMYYVPSAGAVMGKTYGTEGWAAFPNGVTRTINVAAKELKPFSPPEVSTVYVNWHRSVDPAPYSELLGRLEPAPIPETQESPISISISWKDPNPWSSDGAMLSYFVRSKVVMRFDGYFHVPGAIAGRLDRERQGLAPVVPGDDFPWPIVGGGLGGLLALGAAALAWRRRPRPEERPVPA